jgi:hypothetical protein
MLCNALNIKVLVDDLIELFPAAQSIQREYCMEDGADLASDAHVSVVQPLVAEQDPELDTALKAVRSDPGQTFNITFAGSTNHGLQQGYFSGQQTNYCGGRPS